MQVKVISGELVKLHYGNKILYFCPSILILHDNNSETPTKRNGDVTSQYNLMSYRNVKQCTLQNKA